MNIYNAVHSKKVLFSVENYGETLGKIGTVITSVFVVSIANTNPIY